MVNSSILTPSMKEATYAYAVQLIHQNKDTMNFTLPQLEALLDDIDRMAEILNVTTPECIKTLRDCFNDAKSQGVLMAVVNCGDVLELVDTHTIYEYNIELRSKNEEVEG